MKTKKAANEFGITKIISIILIVLVIVAVFVFLFRAGLIQKFMDIPGFSQNHTLEKIDLTTCPVPVARISGDKILMCADEICDEKTAIYDGFFIDKTQLKIGPSSKTNLLNVIIGTVGTLKIGTFYGQIKIDEDILKGVGQNYFQAYRDYFDREGIKLDKLLSLDGTFLVGKTTLCRFNKIDSNAVDLYLRDVRIKEIGGKKFYFAIGDMIVNGPTKKTIVFDDEILTKPSQNAYVNGNYEFIYINAENKEENRGSAIDKNKLFSLSDLGAIKSAEEIGINKITSTLSANIQIVNGRNYTQFTDGKKAISPWVLEDYYKIYGNIGRIELKPSICLNNNCGVA